MSENYKKRFKVQILYESSITDVKTLMKLTKIPKSTVKRTANRIKLEESVKRRSGSGAPQKLTANGKKRISNLVNSHPKYSCARIDEMTRRCGRPHVCQETFWHHLKKVRLYEIEGSAHSLKVY